MTLRGVLFDYGGVITTPVRDSIRSWTEREGIDPQSFSRVLKAWLARSAPDGTPLHRLETGQLPLPEFNRLLGAELRTTDGSPVPDADHVQGIFAASGLDQGVVTLVEELRQHGIRVGLLSNSWGNGYPRELLDRLFEVVVISGEVGLRKPHREIFDLALERLGLPAGEVAFVDDAVPNIDGAEAAGLHAVLHRDAAGTRAQLAQLLPVLNPLTTANSQEKQ